jgi:hypothetical protein
MALVNCSIDTKSLTVTANQALSGAASQVLTITPDPGYVVDHNDFTIASPPTGISSITKANSGTAYADDNKVLVTCDLDNSFNPGFNSQTFTIDVDGEAKDKLARSFTYAGQWRQNAADFTISPVTANNVYQNYSGSSLPGESNLIINQTYSVADAAANYINGSFGVTFSSGIEDMYEVVKTATAYNSTGPTSVNVKVYYIGQEQNVSGHTINITKAQHSDVPTATNLITGFIIDDSVLNVNGETRTISVYGNPGASCKILAKVTGATPADDSWYNFTSNTFALSTETYSSNFTIPNTGIYEDAIVFPAITITPTSTYTIQVIGGTSPTTNTTEGSNDNNNAFSKTILQKSDITITTTATGTGLSSVYTNNVLSVNESQLLYDDFGNPFGGLDLSIVVTHSPSKNLYLRRQPVFSDDIAYAVDNSSTIDYTAMNDFTNTISGSNGGSVFQIAGLTATGNGTTTITISSSAEGYAAFAAGSSNVASVLNLDNFINQAPTSNALSINVDYQTAKAITLNASDPESDTLTYSIVSSPSNGALSGLNTATGAVTYTPNSSYSGSDSFTYKVNDTYEDSNTATVTLTVAGSGGASVARYEMEFYNSSGVLSGTHYIHATQVCQSGSLAVTCMDFGTLTNKWVKWRTVAGGCGSTEYSRGKIKGAASNGTPTAYVSGDTYYNNMADSASGSNGVTC